MYADVIVEYPVKSLDKMFTYKIPNNLISLLKVGHKVTVEFNNKTINGFVVNIKDTYNDIYELKSIVSIVDEKLVLSEELLKLGKHMHQTLLCTLISAYQTMFPTSLKIKNQTNNYDLYNSFCILDKPKEEIISYINTNKKSKKQNEVLSLLLTTDKVLKNSSNASYIKALETKGLVKIIKEKKYRNLYEEKYEKVHNLNQMQENVYNSVDLNSDNTYLLYGVTGSGKTEVYLKLIEDVIKEGKTAIMLAPEISLTMQIVKRFYARFKDEVAVFHSALSPGEKHDEYLRIVNGDVKVVVGTRSAIFTPLTNIGLIIIDEEHSDTYKQDNSPKYHAKDMALFRSKYNKCPLVLGSATPSLEAMARASKGVYKLLSLPHRANNSILPEVTLVDMAKEIKNKHFTFSKILEDKINDRIRKDEQVILLLNRRGFSTFVSCASCGFVYKCPNCDISLIYHKTTNNLVCHYCSYQIKKNDKCPECSEDGLKYLGLGTEKLEEEIINKFEGAKVVRMDQDTTSKKGSHDKIIEDFKSKKYNILLGTQMIAKGLDFKDVTLVGVINADTSLNVPDYKANENTFSLLNQVAGRAGRSNLLGEVILQTFNPDNSVLNLVKENDYLSFYQKEMPFRQKLKYPPYYYLVSIKAISKDYHIALEEAKRCAGYLKNNLSDGTIVLGPTTAAILKFNNNYRFQIIIKYKKDDKLLSVLKELENSYLNHNNFNLDIDINPSKI